MPVRYYPAIYTILGISFLILGLLAPFDFSHPIQRVLGIAFFALIFWTAEPIPIELTSILVLSLFPLAGLLSFEQSFSPFAGKTIWLVFCGMVISSSITETHLGDKLVQFSLRYLGRTPFRLLLNLHLLGLALALLIPSGVVRILLLMPLGIALVEALDSGRSKYLAPALLLSLICSTLYGGFGVLTGSVPNLVVAGQLEQITGQVIYWSQWLALMFPIIGALRVALCFALIWILFGRKIAPEALAPSPAGNFKINLEPRQRLTLAILLLGMIFWATDLFHHIPPVYIGLALVLFCTLPPYGPLPFDRVRQINFPFLFYIAALFSLGSALEIAGFNAYFIEVITLLVDIGQYGTSGKLLAITFATVPLNFLMDVAAVAGVLTPAMVEWGQTFQLEAFPIAMSVALATSQVFLPYQSAPFMVAYSYRRLGMGQLVLAMFLISLLSLLLLCPLNILYWHLLGFF